ncbi:hypothetical protein TI39_contig859g00001 [Zymoseptoria brevis]|uniref:Methyltransferase n=1 Tax=Zymoseptoria brevis TaxID=1047168 RepID=A0A0F4GEV8_9PEZI|nr:hypothetical protein TI39_contig859g00001 [Zymoseptoria brevis]
MTTAIEAMSVQGSPLHPHTTGRIELVNGTNDGASAFIDPSTGHTNLNPKKIHQVDLYDIREQHPPAALATEGYQFLEYPTMLTEQQFMSYQSTAGKQFIQDAYWPEVRRLVETTLLSAARVVPWHFSVRNAMPGYHPDEVFFMKTGVAQPQANLHSDNDHVTAAAHLVRVFGEESAAELLSKYKRWCMINTWRPIGEPVQSWPLVIVDHSKVSNWQYETHVTKIHRSNDPAYYKKYDNFLKHDPDYVYRYVSRHAPDEVIMFRDYDSRKDRYRGTPHGAFQDDQTPADAPSRRSIEVRCFVFFEEEDG